MAAEASRGGEAILFARGVRKCFGALTVLDGVDIEVRRGEALGIVGPNGAGKTTLLDVLAGAQRPNDGRVYFEAADVTAARAAARCRAGIGRSHQVPRPFGGMTVFENVLVGAMTGGGLRGGQARERSIEMVDRCELLEVANRPAEALGLLDRKRLEMARALVTEPTVLLLDEVAGGLSEQETAELVETIQELRRGGLAIIWIEHVVKALLQVAERLVCMSAGRIIAEGNPDTVMSDPAVIDAYLGSSAA